MASVDPLRYMPVRRRRAAPGARPPTHTMSRSNLRPLWALGAALALVAPLARAEDAPLTLEQAVSLAVERNERTRSAGERAQAAAARVGRARAFFFPELSATGTYTRRQRETTREVGGETVVIQRRDALGTTATARWTLFDARGFPLLRAARLEGEAAGLEARDARRQVGFEAAQAFLTTLNAQQVRAAAEQRLAFARATLEDARARAEAGLTSSNDVTRAELEASTAEVEAAQARGSEETSRLELAYLLVLEAPPARLAPPEALFAAATRELEAPEGPAREALARRPDVEATRKRAEALSAQAGEPLMRLLPTLGVSAQYRLTNEAGLSGRTGDGTLGADLSWTLFDGGERYAERRERLSLARAAALDAKAVERRVGVEVEQARVSFRNAQAALQQGTLAARAAQKNAEEAAELYRQGLASALTVADASLRLFEAEVALARARFGLGLALLDFRAAVGLDPVGKEQ